MKLIFLTQGYSTQVSDYRYDYLMQWSWHVAISKSGHMYATRNVSKYESILNKRTRLLMHHLIWKLMGNILPPDKEIDHRDHNGLNNIDSNLREATALQNAANKLKHKDNKSGYIGVIKRGDLKYEAFITYNYKRKFLGFYSTKEMAARVRDYHAIKYYGEFASLNFEESRELYKF